MSASQIEISTERLEEKKNELITTLCDKFCDDLWELSNKHWIAGGKLATFNEHLRQYIDETLEFSHILDQKKKL